jgi:hypothetical protein
MRGRIEEVSATLPPATWQLGGEHPRVRLWPSRNPRAGTAGDVQYLWSMTPGQIDGFGCHLFQLLQDTAPSTAVSEGNGLKAHVASGRAVGRRS